MSPRARLLPQRQTSNNGPPKIPVVLAYGIAPIPHVFPTPVDIMTWRDRIETNPDVLSGKPIVAGTRIAVELVVELWAEDWSTDEILEQYPALSRDDIQACLHALCP